MEQSLVDKIWAQTSVPTIENNCVSTIENNCVPTIENNCVHTPYITNEGIVCDTCGIILERTFISEQKEYRTFSNDDGCNGTNMDRVGGSFDPLLPVSSMSTFIAGDSKMSKLNMWLSIPYDEKVILDLKKKLTEITILHSIPSNIIYNTLVMFKKILTSKNDDGSKEIHRGRIKDGLIAFCLHYSAKLIGIDISLTNLLSIFNIDKKIYNKCTKIYYEHVGVSKINTSLTDISDRLCNQLGLPYKIQVLCKKLVHATKQLRLFDKYAPQSIASGLICFLSIELNLIVPIDKLSTLSYVSSSTISKISKLINTNKAELFTIVKNNK